MTKLESSAWLAMERVLTCPSKGHLFTLCEHLSMQMDSIQGFILAGGASSRMGTDKSRLTISGQTFAQRIAGEMSCLTSAITLIGHFADDPDFNSAPDIYPHWGALGGLHAALSNCAAEWALVTACDLPFVSGELFERMAGLRRNFEAVAPIQADGFPQPLCALYRVNPCLSVADELIQNGERRPIKLLQTVQTRWIQFSELSDLNGAGSFFDNINTPVDYARARTKGGSRSKG